MNVRNPRKTGVSFLDLAAAPQERRARGEVVLVAIIGRNAMSYDPNPPRHRIQDEQSSTGMWIAGAVAVCIVLGLVAFAATRSSNTSVSQSPAATTTTRAPAGTTGSGAATPGTDKPSQPANPLPPARQ